MSRKKQIFTLFEDSRDQLKAIGVKSIGVFGSVVREEDTEQSDCDILVEFNPENHKFKNFNKLCDFLEEYIGEDYDLVTKEGLSPYFGQQVLEEVEYVRIAS